MCRPRTWVFFTLGLTIFGVATLLVGAFTPFWVYLDSNGVEVGVGLFYRMESNCNSNNDDLCTNAPSSFSNVHYDSPSTHDKDHWSVVTGLILGGVGMGILLLAAFIVYACLFSSKRSLSCLNTLSMIAAIFTWIPVGAGLIVFAIYHGDAFTEAPDVSTRSFSWSSMICFISAIILVVITILIRSCCRKDDYITNIVPSSVDHKMALYPSTQSAMFNSYFAPAAYRGDRWQILGNVLEQDKEQAQTQPETMPSAYPYDERLVSNGQHNRGFERDRGDITASPRSESQHRMLRTEVVLDRRAQPQDLYNENKDIIIYKGKDYTRKDASYEPTDMNVTVAGSPNEGNIPKSESSRTFLYSAQHVTDQDAHRGEKYMVHTDKPSETVPSDKRLTLSPNTFADNSVKYNPSYVYRPYSEQVY